MGEDDNKKEFGGLGFRNLDAFNLSILGKQGWKNNSNPEAMISRLLKAKYFLKGQFLDLALGHNPTFSWCSIWSSWILLKEGLRWRVGDGNQIKVWGEPWLYKGKKWSFPSIIHVEKHSMMDWLRRTIVEQRVLAWGFPPCWCDCYNLHTTLRSFKGGPAGVEV